MNDQRSGKSSVRGRRRTRRSDVIFGRVRLRPHQLRTVADRRFDDASALRQTGKNARANGAIYLGGFVIECLLKARLLDAHPWLQNAGSPAGRSHRDQRLWSLCYRSHDLDLILAELPDIEQRLAQNEQRGGHRLRGALKSICASWTVQARYSPHTADMRYAQDFLNQIREIRPCLT